MSKKDEEEFEFEDRKKRNLREKMFGGGEPYQERKYLEGLREKEAKEVESVLTANFPKEQKPTKSKYATIEELKHLGREVKQEVTEYPKRKFQEAAEDIETEREYRKAYREGQKKYKLESATHRGRRHLHEKLYEKEVDKLKREQAIKDIVVSEEKAYRVARASQAGRERAKIESGQYTVTRPKIVRPQLYGISQQVVAQQPRRRIYNPFTPEAARALDQLGIYSLGSPSQASNLQYSDLWLQLVGMPPRRHTQPQSESIKNGTKKRSGRWITNWSTMERYWVSN